MARHRSCYHDNYIVEDEETCVNKAWMDNWKEVSICRDGSVSTTKQATETPALYHDTAAHIADLAVKGSTVAIAASDDPMYDFFLLKDQKVLKSLTATTRMTTTLLLQGGNIHDMTFILDEKCTAAVYAATVRHICGELQGKKKGRKNIYKRPLRETE